MCVHNPQWTTCQCDSDPNVGVFFCCCKTISPNADALLALHFGYDLFKGWGLGCIKGFCTSGEEEVQGGGPPLDF